MSCRVVNISIGNHMISSAIWNKKAREIIQTDKDLV